MNYLARVANFPEILYLEGISENISDILRSLWINGNTHIEPA